MLLVEDDDAVRALVSLTLERHGYHVIKASTPEEALALAKTLTERLDLVLTDVIMPGMRGPDMVARLQEVLPPFHVLYLSGYPSDALGLPTEGMQASVRWLQKPFAPGRLLEVVREVLDASPD